MCLCKHVCWCIDVSDKVSCLKLDIVPCFLSHFPSLDIFLAVDNMVDKTKVETSEVKAIELEKKVKCTQQNK